MSHPTMKEQLSSGSLSDTYQINRKELSEYEELIKNITLPQYANEVCPLITRELSPVHFKPRYSRVYASSYFAAKSNSSSIASIESTDVNSGSKANRHYRGHCVREGSDVLQIRSLNPRANRNSLRRIALDANLRLGVKGVHSVIHEKPASARSPEKDSLAKQQSPQHPSPLAHQRKERQQQHNNPQQQSHSQQPGPTLEKTAAVGSQVTSAGKGKRSKSPRTINPRSSAPGALLDEKSSTTFRLDTIPPVKLESLKPKQDFAHTTDASNKDTTDDPGNPNSTSARCSFPLQSPPTSNSSKARKRSSTTHTTSVSSSNSSSKTNTKNGNRNNNTNSLRKSYSPVRRRSILSLEILAADKEGFSTDSDPLNNNYISSTIDIDEAIALSSSRSSSTAIFSSSGSAAALGGSMSARGHHHVLTVPASYPSSLRTTPRSTPSPFGTSSLSMPTTATTTPRATPTPTPPIGGGGGGLFFLFPWIEELHSKEFFGDVEGPARRRASLIGLQRPSTTPTSATTATRQWKISTNKNLYHKI